MSVLVGEVRLDCLPDAVGILGEYAELYPDDSPDAWEPYRQLYPELFAGESWRLPCKAFLVRSAGTTVLVDTGVGPPGLWGWTAEDEGRLPDALAELGVGAEDVDVVFLTHLHIDHLGWNADLDGAPYFANARYLVHRDALAFVERRAELPHVRRCVLPLLDRFERLTGATELAAGVTAFPAPGHYPGHMAVRIESEGGEALLLADVAVHPAMLDEPSLGYVSDLDAAVSIQTRRATIPELVDRDVLAVCGHYPGTGIGRVVTRAGRLVWEEAA